MQSMQDRIKQYLAYKEAYYLGEPLISDEEFDQFEDELTRDGYDPIVGYVEIPEAKKLKHRHAMLSLGKHKVLTDEMPIELAHTVFNKYGKGILSWKYDGVALDVAYTNGKLDTIVTRGNGTYGQNKTSTLWHLFPERIKCGQTLNIRCEVVMKTSVFNEKYAEKYAHSRNLVAGIINDDDLNDPRKQDIVPIVLEIIDESGLIQFQYPEEFDGLVKESWYCESPQDIKNYFDQCVKTRDDFEFGTDGMVYASSNVDKFKHDGHHPEHAIAIKFKPPMLTSTVTNITWKLHKTGRYVPIVWFEPIIVDGRRIIKASGHNLEYLVKHNITKGTMVKITLANDIIPQISMI